VAEVLTLVRAVAWLAVVTIILLSVVPGDIRPNMMASQDYEHFVAYLITGCLFAAGYSSSMQVITSGIMLSMLAGILEIAQLWIPGRSSKASDAVVSMLGAWVGLGVTWVLADRVRDRSSTVDPSK
jgi:VanZ family protein